MKIGNDVLEVLGRCICEGTHLRLPEQVDRKLYLAVNKVLEAAGGKWTSGKVKAHVFAGDAAAAIDVPLLTGEIAIPKDEFDFFETPADVVRRLITLADPWPDHRILEPSAGTGAILELLLETFGYETTAIELNVEHARKLEFDWPGIVRVLVGDFLQCNPDGFGRFDRVLMNPPFSGSKGLDHFLHAITFLNPGGRCVAILPAGITFRTDRRWREVRELIEAHGYIEPLPDGAFKSSGTMVNTVIAVYNAE